MVKYRNINDGRVVERPAGPDEALEQSVAWELYEEPDAEAEVEPTNEED